MSVWTNVLAVSYVLYLSNDSLILCSKVKILYLKHYGKLLTLTTHYFNNSLLGTLANFTAATP